MNGTNRPDAVAVRRPHALRVALALAFGLVLACLGLSGTAGAAEAVAARAGLHDGYARMAFDLPQGLGHRVESDGTKLAITFDKPVDVALGTLRRYLSDHVGAIALVGESRIEATLSRPYEVRDFMTGRTLVVDLMTSTSAGAAPEPAAMQVGVRVGEHPTYTRVVFDWPSNVDYALQDGDGRTRIRFARPAEFVVPAGSVAGAPRVSGLETAPAKDGASQVVLVHDGRLRHFRDGFKVVIDVLDAPRTAAAPSEPKPERRSRESPVPQQAEPATAKTQAAGTAAVKDAPHDKSGPLEAGPGEAGPVAAAAAAGGAPLALSPHADAEGHTGADPHAEPVAPAANEAHASAATPGVHGEAAHASAPAFSHGKPTALLPTSMQAPADADRPTPALPADVETLPIDVRIDLDGAVIRFPFTGDVGGAVFRRGGHLWIVFDRVYRIDTSRITGEAGEFVLEAEQVPDSRATALRLATAPGFNALTAKVQDRWEVVIVPQLLKPDVAMGVETHLGSVPSVSVGPTVPGTVLRIADPEVGDDIRIATVRNAGDGVAKLRQFADFHLLPSILGVAVVPLSDRVELRAAPDRLIVSAVGGLRLTDAAARAKVLAATGGGGDVERFFDFVGWRHGELGDFRNAEKELLARVGRAGEDARNTERMELARFYLSHGLADRALGVLDLVSRNQPGLTRVPSFLALRGAARHVIGDQAGAERDLFERDLDGEAEILLWRAAVRGVEGDYVTGSLGLQQAEQIVQEYPDALRKRFAFLGVDMALAQDDPVAADFWIEVLEGVEMTPADEERMRVYRGGAAAMNGEVDTALQLYDRAIEGNDRLSRALATMRKAELQLREEVITPGEAAEMLDRLRYVWRGDALEFEILRRLGQLEIAAGRYRDGLQTLKRAAANFPELPASAGIADEMRETFRQLYVEGGADDLPPVTAIALFEEFRELAPAGAEGDEMIRRLADRLVAVDLLDQAASLLEHQVEYRLDGPMKGEVGTRLAMIYLLDRKPGEALDALAESDVNGLPLEVENVRSLVAARAHAQQGDYPRALSSLRTMQGAEADRVRADIYWRQQNWGRAAALFGRLAGAAPEPGEAIDPEKARFVLNRAVALALDGANDDLVMLNTEFAEAMSATPYAADFTAMTHVDGITRNVSDVLQRVAVVDDFKAFMESYRSRRDGERTAPGS